MITVVTTFHEPGLVQYGQRFINSFSQFVDKKIKLIVYAEKCSPENPDPSQVVILDADSTLSKLQDFKEKWKDVPKANGECPHPEKRPKDHHKRFKWDAVRFANKIYAVTHQCDASTDWVVWMDADTVVHTPWSYDDFKNLLPDAVWITYVGRGSKSQTWPECGFYGLNLNNQVCISFLKDFENMYNDAESGIFTLDEWHDSFVFGHLLDQYKTEHPNVVDYSSELNIKTAKSGGGGHPLINTQLGKWIDHLKGDRKSIGKSKKSDILVNRNKNYWT
jgi:hypothetical protein